MGLRAMIDGAKRLVGADRFDRLWYHTAYNSDLWSDSTFNYGYGPVDEAVAADPLAQNQPYQIQMYLEAIRTADESATCLVGKRLLELSCGRGGGLSYLNRRFAPAEAYGLDRSGAAIRRAGARDPSCRWVKASVLDMPFPAASFDVLLCVEALHHYRMECMDEVKRVLRPGGRCIIADSLPHPPSEALLSMKRWFKLMGFTLSKSRDITQAVITACTADSERRRERVNRSPAILRKLLFELTGAAGTDRYHDFVERRRTYFIVVGEKLA